MQKYFRINISIIVILALTSCSAFRSSHEFLSVTASEPKTKIYINGTYVGEAPLQAKVQRNMSVSIMAKKEGFESNSKYITTHFSDTGILDMVGGILCLFPIVGLLTPGAWDIDETNINIHLSKK